MKRWATRTAVLTLLSAFAAAAQAEPQTMLLWPQGAPGALGEEAKDKPTLIAYLPEKSTAPTAAVVICPGGGYGHLAMDHEGHQIAQWLNSFGVAGFICDYRHRGKGYGHPAPLDDAQQAIRTVRANAEKWGVAPQKIGVLGFSAGGHLASTAATHFDAGDSTAADPVARASCRPDFAVLCYAVIAFGESYSHGGSQRNLLGPDAPQELVEKFSNEKQVTSETPPTFLWHTNEDTGVPPQNSAMFYLACVKNKVPAELHIYEKGRHGIGLGKDIPGTNQWPVQCENWMRNHGLAPAKQ
ncbi:MAG: alpha/beta hydrolase [Planctomycetales bacterium]|nr:alpha/beta hydrolase [Planctomycetales bacterium]